MANSEETVINYPLTRWSIIFYGQQVPVNVIYPPRTLRWFDDHLQVIDGVRRRKVEHGVASLEIKISNTGVYDITSKNENGVIIYNYTLHAREACNSPRALGLRTSLALLLQR